MDNVYLTSLSGNKGDGEQVRRLEDLLMNERSKINKLTETLQQLKEDKSSANCQICLEVKSNVSSGDQQEFMAAMLNHSKKKEEELKTQLQVKQFGILI